MAAASAWAATSPDEMLADPVLEARARALGQELRCLVCQNQAIDDSDADLAQDLRHLVRERLVAGDSDAEIKAFLVARYGDFVLLEPPFRPSTWLLWLGPGLVVLGGGAALALYMRRQRPRTGETAPLSPAERAQLAKLLRDSGR
jgi:cytochrome c-type biogenesis protein CcmH